MLTTDLSDMPREPEFLVGSLNCEAELRVALCEAIDGSPHDRYEIARRMSELTGKKITKAMLDTWTAESKPLHRFPYEFSAAFEAACGPGCDALQSLLARKRGRAVLSGDELLFAKLGAIRKKQEDLKQQEQDIKRHLGKKR
jgi:hypothetical protein